MKLFRQALCSIIALSFVFSLQFISAVAQRQPPNIDEILRRLPPNVRNQVMKDNMPKGEMTFEPISSGSAFGLKNIGAPVSSVPPTDAAMRGGTVFVTEVGYCGDTLTTKYMYVLFLDEESRRSTFITNQKGKTANLKLYGNMRRWEHNCDSKKPAYREVAGGEGGMEVDFITTAHIRPRFFQVMASPTNIQGKIWGPGLKDNLRPNPNVPAGPVAFSYAQSENKASYSPAVLAALKRAGYPVPDRIPDFNEGLDRVKAAGFEVADINKPYFHGNLSGTETFTLPRVTVPKLFVSFHVSSTDIDAEMFVYKPKALSAGNTSASGTNPSNTSSAINTNYPYPFGTSYAHPLVNARNTNSNNGGQTSSSGAYVLIPDGLQSVRGAQAFVNLDNDDKDDKFDDFDNKVAGGDDDMVKVVLKVKIKSFTAKAKLEVTQGGEYVKVWKSEEKERGKEFTDLGAEMIVTRKFLEREGDYRILTLWVEGITPHLRQKATEFKFTYWEDTTDNTPDKEETFTMTVIGIESIVWEGKDGNSRNDTNDLDKDLNHKNPGDAFFDPCVGTEQQSTLKPEAVRVFPGWRMINGVLDRKRRDIVKAKVKLSVAPVEPVNIYFDSFDVDDPSAAGTNETEEHFDPVVQRMVTDTPAEPSWVDKETGVAEDNRGTVSSSGGASKSGRFIDESENGILKEEFSTKEQYIEFIVSMQPGDNFRVVGNSDEDFLLNLENDDEKLNKGGSDSLKNENKQRIVDKSVLEANRTEPKEAEILEPDKYASKVLTVWRFFHAEVDYMGEIKNYTIQGNVRSIEPDTPTRGQTKINLYQNLTDELKRFTNVSIKPGGKNGVKDTFQEGKIFIRNVAYDVLHNSAEDSGSDYVIVRGNVVGAPESRYFLRDDSEDTWGFRAGVMLEDVPIPGRDPVDVGDACYVAQRYQDAYVVPDFKTLKPSNRERNTVEYIRNLKSINDKYDDEMRRIYKFDNKATEASQEFWTIYLLFGHIGATYEDGDPDGGSAGNLIPNTVNDNPVEGITDDASIGIIVFLEGVIERNTRYQRYNGKTGEEDCIAHEIGHIFGAPHNDKGVMGPDGGQDTIWFSYRTLDRIRRAKHP